MSNIRIEYDAIAIGASDAFKPSIDGLYPQSDSVSRITKGTAVKTNPCELYCTSLDGTATLLENESDSKGVWSANLSDEHGDFKTPLTLALTSSAAFSVSDFGIISDDIDNVFPTNMHITAYLGDLTILDDDFVGTGAKFYLDDKLTAFDKIEITFNSINLPNCRLRLSKIEFGSAVTFGDDEISSVKIIQQISPVSAELCISTCDIVLKPKEPNSYIFQKSQPMKVYQRNKLIGKFFITEAKRKDERTWSLTTEDYIGLMEDVNSFGVILPLSSIRNAVSAILATVSYSASSSLPIVFKTEKTSQLRGLVKPDNLRNSLGQLAFAANLLIDTTYSEDIEVKDLSTKRAETISLDRIMQGIKVEDLTPASSVTVTAHDHMSSLASQRSKLEELYTAVAEDIGKETVIQHQNDKYYWITDETVENVENLTSRIAWCSFIPNEGAIINGYPILDRAVAKTKVNPESTYASDKKDVTVQNATLVTRLNADEVLERCYNQYTRSKKVKCKVIERQTDRTLRVGDIVAVETPFLVEEDYIMTKQIIEGRITKSTFSLIGGITVKDIEVE